jgi:hypothetical protein
MLGSAEFEQLQMPTLCKIAGLLMADANRRIALKTLRRGISSEIGRFIVKSERRTQILQSFISFPELSPDNPAGLSYFSLNAIASSRFAMSFTRLKF